MEVLLGAIGNFLMAGAQIDSGKGNFDILTTDVEASGDTKIDCRIRGCNVLGLGHITIPPAKGPMRKTVAMLDQPPPQSWSQLRLAV